jgi:signal transduction histidine kinase
MGLAVLTMNRIPGQEKPPTPLTPEILVPRLGESLVSRNLLTEAQLQRALDYQHEQTQAGKPVLIGQAIIDLGFLDRPTLDRAVTEQIILLRQALEESNRNLERRVQERTSELQEALRKLADLNQLKANFVSNISHELRTPLTHVKGYIELLSTESLGPVNADQRKALNISQHAANRLQSLIDDLILFSVAERGELSLQLKSVNVSKIANEIAMHSQQKAHDANVTLLVEVEPDLPSIQADEQKISWVLLQLLDNAIKFTPANGKVILAIKRLEQSGMVDVIVSDTGIGIPKERFGEIFEPFHQLDGSATRRYGGTGLGLALVREIVEAHGSIISVKSVVGQGTSFSFPLLCDLKEVEGQNA